MKKYVENMKEYDGTCGKYEGIFPLPYCIESTPRFPPL